MSDTAVHPPPITGWDISLQVGLCDRCQRRFLAPSASSTETCPNCHRQGLAGLPESLPEMPYPYPPELVAPFSLSRPNLQAAISHFAQGIPYAPDDLNSQTLQARLTPVYLPVWLVDASVNAAWQAETGYDYQVISHQEYYNQDQAGWKTREVKEDRIRWENRVGRMNRAYTNISAPALEEYSELQESLGDFQRKEAQPYQPAQIAQAFIRLPDLPPEEAWKEAAASFEKVAADEVRQACEAGHLRQFRWKATFSQINWTLMLVPIFTSYYRNDSGQPQTVLINGQSGRITGSRRASMTRARRTSLTLLLAGIILFLAGLILNSLAGASSMSVISTLITLAGIACAVGSIIPIATVWNFNRKQALRSLEVHKT